MSDWSDHRLVRSRDSLSKSTQLVESVQKIDVEEFQIEFDENFDQINPAQSNF